MPDLRTEPPGVRENLRGADEMALAMLAACLEADDACRWSEPAGVRGGAPRGPTGSSLDHHKKLWGDGMFACCRLRVEEGHHSSRTLHSVAIPTELPAETGCTSSREEAVAGRVGEVAGHTATQGAAKRGWTETSRKEDGSGRMGAGGWTAE
ncbi:hypothetical protein C8T65DRAFT_695913 [Cerioporus squamosus]|nr:hypothetical protein C8T65DRAFT_695913 [Cerioporus squamosus]